MKIRLLKSLPIDSRHKAVKGKVFTVVGKTDYRNGYKIKTATGDETLVWEHECVVIED